MGNCIGRVSNENESDYLEIVLFQPNQQQSLTIENMSEEFNHDQKIITLISGKNYAVCTIQISARQGPKFQKCIKP